MLHDPLHLRLSKKWKPKCELGISSHLGENIYSFSHLYLKFVVILTYLSHRFWQVGVFRQSQLNYGFSVSPYPVHVSTANR